jgi:tetratricopeptide (TPR) repeat protein
MSQRLKNKAKQGKAADVRSNPAVSPVGEIPDVKGSRSLESKNRPFGLNDRWMVPMVCIFLVAAIWLVFGQTLHHDFVNFDDDQYVYDNPVVQKGLSWEGFCWALTYGNIGHWHPLTWLSHMLDCQLYGLHAGGHHLTNLLLHGAAAILLFLVLRRMTGSLWSSAFVAAVFAIHPLRAESVAWVSERKDVLSAFFFMLTLGAYVCYVRRPPSITRYGTVVLFYALGLLSKNMLVTMPFVLLLLDYWPLNRLSGFSLKLLFRRVAEKIPLLVLAVGSCMVTVLVPEKMTAARLPFGLRMENAVVSYVTYLWQMFHPSGLACIYPNPANYLPLWQVAGALGLLLAISGTAWAFRKTHPCLIVGWLWYLGMMVPVIGIVQISSYAHADRYTYLPQIGLYLLLTWAVADICAGWRHRRVVLGGCATIILLVMIFYARVQTSYWRNSESLWTHTLACTSDNDIAHNGLGNVLLEKGSVDEAIIHYQMALQIKPNYAEVCYNLGSALLQKGEVAEATTHFQMALQIKPDFAEAHNNLGSALLQKGRVNEAITHFQMALQIKPDYADAHHNLGCALLQKGRVNEAITHFQMALQIKPDFAEAQINLSWILATSSQASLRNGTKAVELAQQANRLTGGENPNILTTLAAAYAEAGRFSEATKSAQRALQLAEKQSNIALANAIRSQMKLYQAGIPFHDTE